LRSGQDQYPKFSLSLFSFSLSFLHIIVVASILQPLILFLLSKLS
jgi:hypothetical protein